MTDRWERQTQARLAGYESWLYQMPCMDSTGDLFVCVPLSGPFDPPDQSQIRWLVALGDVIGKGEAASHAKDLMEAEITRLAGIMADPASILRTLNDDLAALDVSDRFATLVVAVIDGERHELTLANAGYVPPILRRADRQTVLLGEETIGFPLWILPGQTYENVTVPVDRGEMVIFHSDGVTAVIDHQCRLFDLATLRRAIVRAAPGAAPVGQSILESMRRFGQGRPQVEDITLLCLGRVADDRQG